MCLLTGVQKYTLSVFDSVSDCLHTYERGLWDEVLSDRFGGHVLQYFTVILRMFFKEFSCNTMYNRYYVFPISRPLAVS